MLTCAITELHSVRNRGAAPSMLAVPTVTVEEDHVTQHRTGCRFLSQPEEPLDRRTGSALALRVELLNEENGKGTRLLC